jgi:hypothetical protein
MSICIFINKQENNHGANEMLNNCKNSTLEIFMKGSPFWEDRLHYLKTNKRTSHNGA